MIHQLNTLLFLLFFKYTCLRYICMDSSIIIVLSLVTTHSLWYFPVTNSGDTHRSGFRFQTPVIFVKCVIFPITSVFVVSLLNIFLVWITNISLNLLLKFRFLQLLPVQLYILCSNFDVSICINSCIYFLFSPLA